MNAPESSPLRALDLLYDRLATDARYDLARPGYSAQKVSFCILLNPDGSLAAIQDERDTSGKKPLARLLTLPGQAKPSGQGLNPCFLWDNSAYLLGYKAPDKNPEKARKEAERAILTFEEFRKQHLALEAALADPGFTAVCAFLRNWTPTRALEYKAQLDDFAATGFGVFRLVGEHAYIHDRPAVAAHWSKSALAADPNAPRGQCLVSGESDVPLAQLVEPAIKGVKDAQPAGGKIVSFNCEAFASYGKTKDDQALNSPISQSSAFRHATALNALLVGPQSRLHRVQIGDATTVFWTGAPTVTEGFLAAFLEGHTPESESVAQDETLRARLGTFFEVLRSGGGRTLDRLTDDATTPFYLLGLSPNQARISVRFWHAGTLGSVVDHLRDHYDALRIIRPPGPQHHEFPAAWQL
ncbi:MAG: type I-C CRISPR-associated protein Cas8c/Csd1, partial [Opitutaceae bacterium]